MRHGVGLVDRVRRTAQEASDVLLHFVADDGVADSVRITDLVAAAEAQATQLSAAGARRGDTVVIRGAGGGRSVAESILACSMAGCVAAPLVSLLGDADVDAILELARAQIFLSDARIRSRDLTPYLDSVITRGALPVAGGIGELRQSHPLPACQSAAPLDPDTDETDVAFILFSSGTTGRPKGVLHSRESISKEVTDFADQLDLTGSGVALQPFPFGHVGGLVGLFLALCLGRESVVLSGWDAAVAFDAIERFGVTATGSTPFFAQTLFDECDRRAAQLPTLRTMESGGGPVGEALVYRAHALGIRMSRGYGSTEHPTACTHHSADPLKLRAETDGRPFNGSVVSIVDADGAEVPSGVEGEVLLRGPEQFIGYLSGDRSSFAAGGWFRTGDLGRIDGAGHLTITGRLKDLIIRGGENVSAVEVENLILEYPGVRETAVIGVADHRFGERVCAYVVRAEGVETISIDDLRCHFERLGVARFKAPEILVETSALPRNSLGKVQKHLLSDPGSNS